MNDEVKPVNGHDLNQSTFGRIVKADHYSSLQDAKDLIAAAEAEAEQILNASKAAYEQAKLDGYEDGLKLARERCVKQMVETAEGCIEYVRNCESSISHLAVNAIEKIIGSCDHQRVTGHLIRQGLERMSSGDELRIRVPTGRLPDYRVLIEEIASPQNRIRLVESDNLENNECLLESSVGVIRLSMQDQVEELKKNIQSVLS